MEVKIKKLIPSAVIPTYAHSTDAGMDLYVTDVEYDNNLDCYVYHTGLAVEIPGGYVGLLFPRSSNRKTNCYLANSVGVIDSGYRGEILFCYKDRRDILEVCPSNAPYKVGDRAAQLIIMPYPHIKFKEVEELEDSDRGEGGFGSTNK